MLLPIDHDLLYLDHHNAHNDPPHQIRIIPPHESHEIGLSEYILLMHTHASYYCSA